MQKPLVCVALVAALMPGLATAALGEPEQSVQADMSRMQASIKSSEDRVSFRMHEISLPSGTLLREFVGPDGNVFGVAWNGPTVPDLRQALGKYFDAFVAAPRPTITDHRHVSVRTADFVVQASGHSRAFSGRAYLPSALPAGFDLGELH